MKKGTLDKKVEILNLLLRVELDVLVGRNK